MRYLIPMTLAVCCSATAPLAAQSKSEIYDGAFRDAQMATGSQTALALSRSAARLAAGNPELASAIRARQDASDAAAKADAAEVAARTAAKPDPAAIAAAAKTAEAGRIALAAADTALSAKSPGYVQLTGIAPVPVKEAQALLAPGEAIVMIHSTVDHSYIFAVTRDRAEWARADIGRKDMDAEVRVLRAALDPGGALRSGEDASGDVQRATTSGFPRARAFALYRKIWAPIAPVIGKASTVYVVAGGPLGGMPLTVLPVRKPGGSDADARAMRKTDWLVRHHALVTLPSVGSLRALRAGQASGTASKPFAARRAAQLRRGRRDRQRPDQAAEGAAAPAWVEG